MSTLKIMYDGDQHATALQEPHHNIVAIDCPYTGKGDEFSPASLLGISLGSCMLLSMGAIAQRDHLDLRGTVVNIQLTGMDKTFPHVDTITVTFDIPRNFLPTDREKLERAAGLCPIMASLSTETTITAIYNYADAKAA
ncbi:MAG: OsmC family protein [Gammaproteobacteria bacterium]|nr:OsmC family protein [Gammaproteobacteria bacterium]MDH3805509.1 OsmC family protein [Gammaproteobacteria bacterium]